MSRKLSAETQDGFPIIPEARLDQLRNRVGEGRTFENNGYVLRESGLFFEREFATLKGNLLLRTEGIELTGTKAQPALSPASINAFRMTMVDLEMPTQTQAILVLDPRVSIARLIHGIALNHAEQTRQTVSELVDRIRASASSEDIDLKIVPANYP